MTIEGVKEQECRSWSLVIELDRGGSMSKDRESEGQESDKVWEGMEKDPKIEVDLDKGTECETSYMAFTFVFCHFRWHIGEYWPYGL